MNPTISNISDEAGVYKFTLDGLNVSLANSIRRTILSDIPINVIKTETYAENQCNILINTTRLHN
jgi:DNA-directed RNA polymerase alpha subunit